jgi:hypothetical protein
VVAPRVARTCMELQMGMPVTALREKTGAPSCGFLGSGRELDAMEVEDAAADTVVAAGVWLIAVEAEAEAAPFRLFLR